MTRPSEKKCQMCLYGDKCHSRDGYGCKHYTPADEDELLDETIETIRNEYYTEWVTYVGDDWG